MKHQKTWIETPKTNHQPWWEVFDGFNLPPRPPVPSRIKELEASDRIENHRLENRRSKADSKNWLGSPNLNLGLNFVKLTTKLLNGRC